MRAGLLCSLLIVLSFIEFVKFFNSRFDHFLPFLLQYFKYVNRLSEQGFEKIAMSDSEAERINSTDSILPDFIVLVPAILIPNGLSLNLR